MYNLLFFYLIKKMGSDYSLYGKKLNNPLFPIIAIDKRFLFPNAKIFYLQGGDCCDDPGIQDNNGNSYFKIKGIALSPRKIIYDTYNKPLFNIDKEFFSFSYILKSGESDQVIANVDKNGFFTSSKFNCTFKNLSTGLNDYIEIKSANFQNFFGVYQGEEKKGAPLICKIYKNPDSDCCSSSNFIIEIAPNIDASLMLGLALIFRDYSESSNNSSSSTTN